MHSPSATICVCSTTIAPLTATHSVWAWIVWSTCCSVGGAISRIWCCSCCGRSRRIVGSRGGSNSGSSAIWSWCGGASCCGSGTRSAWIYAVTVIANLNLSTVPKLLSRKSNFNRLTTSWQVTRVKESWERVVVISLVPATVCSYPVPLDQHQVTS